MSVEREEQRLQPELGEGDRAALGGAARGEAV